MLTLTPAELLDLTRYSQPSRQLAELHRQGFWRARLTRMGDVLLERAHYEAVAQGIDRKPAEARPRVRVPA